MPTPARGTGYEVWVVNRSDRKPAATGEWLHLNPLHQAGVNVSGNYHDWDAVAVYVEPLTGKSTTKGGAVVVGGDLRSLR